MFFMTRINSRPATALRLAGLGVLIWWQLRTHNPAGLSGRGLVVTLLLAGSVISWLAWIRETRCADIHRLNLRWEVFTLAACGGVLVGASSSGPANVFVFVAAFAAGGRAGVPRAFLVTLTAILALSVSAIIYDANGIGGLGVVAYTLGLIAITFGGSQRHQAILRHEQAELLLAQTQRSHEEQLRAARLGESTRIAREIHDVLAHSLAGLTIQLEATVALLEAGADPSTVLERVRHAHTLARDGLRETRLAVGALREGSTVVPATSRIEALVSDFRAAGNDVTLSIEGDQVGLSGHHGDATVRIIQEALTNVIKHAPGSAVRIRIDAGPPLVALIENRCPVSVQAQGGTLAASGGGYGLSGMRERAAELGGTLHAGPSPEGWRVELKLP